MKLKEPIAVREALMDKCGWATIEEIAGGLKLATNTVSRTLRGEPVRMQTIKAIASAIDTTATEIAMFVGN